MGNLEESWERELGWDRSFQTPERSYVAGSLYDPLDVMDRTDISATLSKTIPEASHRVRRIRHLYKVMLSVLEVSTLLLTAVIWIEWISFSLEQWSQTKEMRGMLEELVDNILLSLNSLIMEPLKPDMTKARDTCLSQVVESFDRREALHLASPCNSIPEVLPNVFAQVAVKWKCMHSLPSVAGSLFIVSRDSVLQPRTD